MASVRFFANFRSVNAKKGEGFQRIEIINMQEIATAEEVTLSPDGFILSYNHVSPFEKMVQASGGELTVMCNDNMKFAELFANDPLKYKLIHYTGTSAADTWSDIVWSVSWKGFLQPNTYEETLTDIGQNSQYGEIVYPVTFFFSDFQMLEDKEYLNPDGSRALGMENILTILSRILNKTSVTDSFESLYLHSSISFTPPAGGSEQNWITKSFISGDNWYDEDGVGMSMREVLEEIGRIFSCRIFQKNGSIYMVDNNAVGVTGDVRYEKYSLTDPSAQPQIVFQPIFEGNILDPVKWGLGGTGERYELDETYSMVKVTSSVYPKTIQNRWTADDANDFEKNLQGDGGRYYPYDYMFGMRTGGSGGATSATYSYSEYDPADPQSSYIELYAECKKFGECGIDPATLYRAITTAGGTGALSPATVYQITQPFPLPQKPVSVQQAFFLYTKRSTVGVSEGGGDAMFIFRGDCEGQGNNQTIANPNVPVITIGGAGKSASMSKQNDNDSIWFKVNAAFFYQGVSSFAKGVEYDYDRCLEHFYQPMRSFFLDKAQVQKYSEYTGGFYNAIGGRWTSAYQANFIFYCDLFLTDAAGNRKYYLECPPAVKNGGSNKNSWKTFTDAPSSYGRCTVGFGASASFQKAKMSDNFMINSDLTKSKNDVNTWVVGGEDAVMQGIKLPTLPEEGLYPEFRIHRNAYVCHNMGGGSSGKWPNRYDGMCWFGVKSVEFVGTSKWGELAKRDTFRTIKVLNDPNARPYTDIECKVVTVYREGTVLGKANLLDANSNPLTSWSKWNNKNMHLEDFVGGSLLSTHAQRKEKFEATVSTTRNVIGQLFTYLSAVTGQPFRAGILNEKYLVVGQEINYSRGTNRLSLHSFHEDCVNVSLK
ncbi:hypothetical protein Barb4_02072 [Bacteroidales bacterium Barb4]|nr:hypothetical protein Barb4_02072 [Bacteroidales bacterium Barb4]